MGTRRFNDGTEAAGHVQEAGEALYIYIDHGKIQRLAQLLWGHIAHIGTFHHHHTRIRTDLPIQLTIAHINSKHLTGALLQQAIGKAAGGCTGIAADIAFGLDAKVTQGFLQFQSASADIGTYGTPDLDFNSLFKGSACLVGFLAVDIHRAAHNNRLGFGTGIGIEPFHQQNIQSLLNFHFGAPPQ